MSELPDWLPKLLLFEDYHGCWHRYEDEVYARFYRDFIESKPAFKGIHVYVKRIIEKGKERGFWHCIQEGPVEKQRTPDLRRCERIAWIRAIIEHASDPRVKKWSKKVGSISRLLLWLEEAEFLVVLEKRHEHWLLCTAYCTTWEHTKRKLRKEYKATLK
jgi:hypothetical protein